MATICPSINSYHKRAVFAALLALIAAAPVWAKVNITYAQIGDPCDCRFIISYDATTETNLIRAFSLDIRLDNDANIVEVTALNPDYYIFPGTIQIDAFGNVIDYGTALAEYDDLPSDTLPGLDSNGITIEMASLYAPVGTGSPNAPAKSGDLLSIRVSGEFCTIPTCASCDPVIEYHCITISGNVARAGPTGVVMENPDEIVEVNFPVCDVHHCIGCYCGQPDDDVWERFNKPDCWCWPRQCHGDCDGELEGDPKGGYFYVGAGDLACLLAAWKILEPADPPTPSGPGILSVPNGICADFDHLQEGDPKGGYFRVGAGDLAILLANWKILEPATAPTPSGPGIPADCVH